MNCKFRTVAVQYSTVEIWRTLLSQFFLAENYFIDKNNNTLFNIAYTC